MEKSVLQSVKGLLASLGEIAFEGLSIEDFKQRIDAEISAWGPALIAHEIAAIIQIQEKDLLLKDPDNKSVQAGLIMAKSWALANDWEEEEEEKRVRSFLESFQGGVGFPDIPTDEDEAHRLISGLLLVLNSTHFTRLALYSGQEDDEEEYGFRLAAALHTCDRIRSYDLDTQHGRIQAESAVRELWLKVEEMRGRWGTAKNAESLIQIIRCSVQKIIEANPGQTASAILYFPVEMSALLAGSPDPQREWLDEAFRNSLVIPSVPEDPEDEFILILGLVIVASTLKMMEEASRAKVGSTDRVEIRRNQRRRPPRRKRRKKG